MSLTIAPIDKAGAQERGGVLTGKFAVPGTDIKFTVTDITFDSSYPTGGEAVTAANLGLGTLISVISVSNKAPVDGTKEVIWDHVNSKLIILVEDATSGVRADATNGSNQSAVICRVVSVGY